MIQVNSNSSWFLLSKYILNDMILKRKEWSNRENLDSKGVVYYKIWFFEVYAFFIFIWFLNWFFINFSYLKSRKRGFLLAGWRGERRLTWRAGPPRGATRHLRPSGRARVAHARRKWRWRVAGGHADGPTRMPVRGATWQVTLVSGGPTG